MKKIYFACSITGGRDHAHVYEEIVAHIKTAGLHVLSEVFADKKITPTSGLGLKDNMTPDKIWEWDLNWVREAHAIIAEVTQPSLGVGYEIAKAHEWDKPVLALHYKPSGRRLSPMISGSPNVMVFEYSDVAETQAVINEFVKNLG